MWVTCTGLGYEEDDSCSSSLSSCAHPAQAGDQDIAGQQDHTEVETWCQVSASPQSNGMKQARQDACCNPVDRRPQHGANAGREQRHDWLQIDSICAGAWLASGLAADVCAQWPIQSVQGCQASAQPVYPGVLPEGISVSLHSLQVLRQGLGKAMQKLERSLPPTRSASPVRQAAPAVEAC